MSQVALRHLSGAPLTLLCAEPSSRMGLQATQQLALLMRGARWGLITAIPIPTMNYACLPQLPAYPKNSSAHLALREACGKVGTVERAKALAFSNITLPEPNSATKRWPVCDSKSALERLELQNRCG